MKEDIECKKELASGSTEEILERLQTLDMRNLSQIIHFNHA